MVRGAIWAGQSGAVQHESHRQVLQGDFLEDLIVASLQERTVDIHDRPQAGLGLTGGKGNGVGFADAHVKEAIGKLVTHRFQFVALAHRGRQHRHAGIFAHTLQNGIARHVGVSRRTGGRFRYRQSVLLAEGWRCVEKHRVVRGRFEAVPLVGDDVQ